MAKIAEFNFTAYNLNALESFFDGLNSSFVNAYIQDNYFYLEISDIFVFQRGQYGSAMAYCKGVAFGQSGFGGYGDYIKVVYNNDFIYVFWGSSTGVSPNKSVVMFYEEYNDMKLYGYNYSGDRVYKSLNSLSLTDDISSISYSFGKRLDYSDDPDYLDCASQPLFQGDIITDIIDLNFIACSNTTLNNVLTIQGKNYFTIGTNLLVEVE